MHFHHLFHLGHEFFTTHILSLWLFALVFVVAGGLWLSDSREPMFPTRPGLGIRNSVKKLWRDGNFIDGMSAILFLVFLAVYIVIIFHKEDFAYYDDDMLTDFSVQGKSFSPPVWSALGRFYPLADQEFNVLKIITRSPIGYHTLVAGQLVLLLAMLFIALGVVRVRFRFLILASAMVAPSLLIPFAGFVYPERNVLFWLAVMLLCLLGYSKTRARIYFLGCLIATHFALYYKETVVLFIVTYAISRIVLQSLLDWRNGWRGWQVFTRKNALPLGMLSVSAIYGVFFLAAMLPHWSFSYISGLREPLWSVLLAYFQIDWLPLILIAVLIARCGLFLFSNGQLDPLWDSLAAGALAYFFGVISLRINSGYYMAPVDLFALLYLANMSLVWLSRPKKVRIIAVAIAFSCIFLHDVAYSSFRIVERKGIIASKSEFAEFLKLYLQTAKGNRVELYFPYSNGYHLMGLSSYLRYKGFALEGQPVTSDETEPRLVIAGRGQFDDSRCVDYRDYACAHAESPSPGTLIVILPDDDVSMSDVQRMSTDSDLVFSAIGCAECTKLGAWFKSLHAISAEFSVKPLPEHWLQLDVYRRRL